MWIQLLKAFWVGGAICVIAQLLIDYTKMTPARIMVTYVVAGVVLTALGLYEPVVEYAGSGATVPIVGFGYTLAKGVQKLVEEKGIMGILAGGLTGAAGGLGAAIFFGCIFSLLCKPKAKKP